jgi:hypothetical protein
LSWNSKRWLDVHGKKVRVRFVSGKGDRDLEYGKLGGCEIPPSEKRKHWLIKIDADEPLVKQRLYLLHELTHVADEIAGEPLSHEMVTVQSQLLFDIFDKNPGVAAWIGGGK